MSTPDGRSTPTEQDDEHVATGVIAAERRAQADLARRRRFLVGGAVLGLVIAGAVVAVTTILQQRANTEAQRASDRIEARAAFAEDVVGQAEDYEPLATAVARDAAALRTTLEGLLTETPATDDELATEATALGTDLEAAADSLGELTARELPEPPELVDGDRAVLVLRELEQLRVEARALRDEVPAAVADGRRWLGAVRDVTDALAAHVAQVESEEATSDPGELVELWREERPGLLRLSVAAEAAADVEGLAPWAAAHERYATDVLAWIDEAVELLGDGEIDAYNDRFEELFGTGDPFDFNTAVADATDEALESPALLQLGALQQRADLVLEALMTTETTTADVLDEEGT